MKRWRYVEPGDDGVTPVVVVKTEQEILDQYWEYWQMMMRARGKDAEVSRANCIADWVTVNWAEPVP